MKMPGNWKSRSLVIITLDQNVVGQLALQVAIHRDDLDYFLVGIWDDDVHEKDVYSLIWVVIIWVVSC